MRASWLALPSFVTLVWAIFWCPVLAVLASTLQWWRLRGPRNDTLAMVDVVARFMRVRLRVLGAGRLDRRPGMVYLPNHRSFADFFLDPLLTEGRASVLSRGAVAALFPLPAAALVLDRTGLVFRRGGRWVRDKERFNAWLDARLRKSTRSSFLVYPEGHRSVGGEPLPLKTGMLKFAYSRRMPCQTIIGANKEAVCSEKHAEARFCQTVVVGFGPVVDPAGHPTFEAFMAAVQAAWDAEWTRVLSADAADSVPLPPPAVDMETPLGVRLRLNALLALQVALFCLVHGGLAWLVLRAAAAAPLPTACLVISLAAWLAASVASGSRPHAPQHPSAAAAAPPAVAGAPPEAKAARPRPGAGAAKDE